MEQPTTCWCGKYTMSGKGSSHSSPDITLTNLMNTCVYTTHTINGCTIPTLLPRKQTVVITNA